MTDRDLVRQFMQHRDVLLGFVFALTRDHDRAEELFQETAVAILAEAQKGTQVQDFLPWARTIARHRVMDSYRAQQRDQHHREALESLAPLVEQSFQENLIAAEENQERVTLLRECLERLTRRARTMVEMFYRHRRPLREIARRLDWKETSVKVSLAKTRRALAECVEKRLASAEGVP